MASKKRISDEAFPWVRNTTGDEKKEEKKTAIKKSASTDKIAAKVPVVEKVDTFEGFQPASVKESLLANSGDTVFVLFGKKGEIHSVAKIDKKYLPDGKMPFVPTTETMAAELKVPNELADKNIAEVHRMCRVQGVGTQPELVIIK